MGRSAGQNQSSFQTIPSITNIKQIAAGGESSFGLKTDGTLIACGHNGSGKLGLNTSTASNYTFQTVPSVTNIKQIAVSAVHSLGLKTDGTLIACGYDGHGQLGLNSTAAYSSFQSAPSITNIKQIAGGMYHSLGLKTDGTLISCGNNIYGALGLGVALTSKYSSFKTIPSITNIKQIYAGNYNSYVMVQIS